MAPSPSESEDGTPGEIGWYSPDPRAIFPLEEGPRVSRSLRRRVRARPFEIRTDTAFETVVRECAAPRPDRLDTWIDERIVRAYVALHELGFAHSVEAWRDDQLVGGLYGVHLRGAFCGESMFSRPELGGTDASKISLLHLIDMLRAGGFVLLDTQFTTPHLASLGCVEIPRSAYLERLRDALGREGTWPERVETLCDWVPDAGAAQPKRSSSKRS